MKKSRFSESQIIRILKEADGGRKVADICREHGVSQAAYYQWKAKFGGTDVSEGQRQSLSGCWRTRCWTKPLHYRYL